jgi:hypothetical protein
VTEPTEPTEPTEATEPRPETGQGDILSHLQAAAKELIAAGRAALDVADEMAGDGIRLLSGFLARERQEPAAAPTVERIDVVKVEPVEPVEPGERPPSAREKGP